MNTKMLVEVLSSFGRNSSFITMIFMIHIIKIINSKEIINYKIKNINYVEILKTIIFLKV